MQEVISFLVENQVIVLAALLAISEVMASIPVFKSNSIFQAIYNMVKGFKKK